MSSFTALVTKDERVLVTREGRTMAVLAGARASGSRKACARSATRMPGSSCSPGRPATTKGNER